MAVVEVEGEVEVEEEASWFSRQSKKLRILLLTLTLIGIAPYFDVAVDRDEVAAAAPVPGIESVSESDLRAFLMPLVGRETAIDGPITPLYIDEWVTALLTPAPEEQKDRAFEALALAANIAEGATPTADYDNVTGRQEWWRLPGSRGGNTLADKLPSSPGDQYKAMQKIVKEHFSVGPKEEKEDQEKKDKAMIGKVAAVEAGMSLSLFGLIGLSGLGGKREKDRTLAQDESSSTQLSPASTCGRFSH